MLSIIISIVLAASLFCSANARAIALSSDENNKLARVNEGLYSIKTVLKSGAEVNDAAALVSIMEVVQMIANNNANFDTNTTVELVVNLIWSYMIKAVHDWALDNFSVESKQLQLLQAKHSLVANVDKYYSGLREYKVTSGILYCNWIHSLVCNEQSVNNNNGSTTGALQYVLTRSECENLSSLTMGELNCS